jgi:hypothetical protein
VIGFHRNHGDSSDRSACRSPCGGFDRREHVPREVVIFNTDNLSELNSQAATYSGDPLVCLARQVFQSAFCQDRRFPRKSAGRGYDPEQFYLLNDFYLANEVIILPTLFSRSAGLELAPLAGNVSDFLQKLYAAQREH